MELDCCRVSTVKKLNIIQLVEHKFLNTKGDQFNVRLDALAYEKLTLMTLKITKHESSLDSGTWC